MFYLLREHSTSDQRSEFCFIFMSFLKTLDGTIRNLLVSCELCTSASPHTCEFKAHQFSSTGISCEH